MVGMVTTRTATTSPNPSTRRTRPGPVTASGVSRPRRSATVGDRRPSRGSRRTTDTGPPATGGRRLRPHPFQCHPHECWVWTVGVVPRGRTRARSGTRGGPGRETRVTTEGTLRGPGVTGESSDLRDGDSGGGVRDVFSKGRDTDLGVCTGLYDEGGSGTMVSVRRRDPVWYGVVCIQ